MNIKELKNIILTRAKTAQKVFCRTLPSDKIDKEIAGYLASVIAYKHLNVVTDNAAVLNSYYDNNHLHLVSDLVSHVNEHMPVDYKLIERMTKELWLAKCAIANGSLRIDVAIKIFEKCPFITNESKDLLDDLGDSIKKVGVF